MRCRAYLSGTGILTGFPFAQLAISLVLRIALPLAEEHGQGNRVLSASRILAWICCY